jgi:hypothetical protein
MIATPTITTGSPAAGLTRPPAARGRAVNGQPDRAEHRECARHVV